MHIEQAEAVQWGSWEMQRVLMQNFGVVMCLKDLFFDWTVKTGCNDFSHSSMLDLNKERGVGDLLPFFIDSLPLSCNAK